MKKLLILTWALIFPAAALAQTANIVASAPTYAAGTGSITFTVTLNYTGTMNGIGLDVLSVPAGWSYASAGGSVPEIKPNVGDTDSFSFAYFNTIPASPAVFTFTVNYPAGLSGNQTFSGISGKFRASGPEVSVPVPNVIIANRTPVITWAAPAPIPYGTALSATQLNATVNTPGVFVYTPDVGAVLNVGNNQTLSVAFTPTDMVNYTTATGSTTISVTKATPTITWNTPTAITYGTALSATQLNATASVPGTFVYTPAAGAVLNAGVDQPLSVTFTPTDSGNYNVATATTTLTVNKATPSIGWTMPAPITYGTALGVAQLNALATIPGTYTYAPPAGTILNASATPHPLSVTFVPNEQTNYTDATASTTIVVNKATPAITWNAPAAITYGTALSATQLNATANTLGTFTYVPAAGFILNVGANQTLATTFNPTDTGNYNPTTATTTITVNKAVPAITWNTPAPITYGTALSSVQLNASSPVAGTFLYSPVAGHILNAGPNQTLSVTLLPTDTANYDPATATTTITVIKATPTIAWTPPAAITYGTALSSVQLNAVPSVPGTLAYTPDVGAVLNAGPNQILSVALTPTDSTNYTNASATTTITVDRATPVVSWSTPTAITYGTLLSGTQLNATASVPGTFAYTPPAGTRLNASATPQPLSTVFTPTDGANYTTANGSTTILVNKADQAITFALATSYSVDQSPVTLSATSTSGLLVSFTSSDTSIATVSGSLLTLLRAAPATPITVTAVQAGDPNYNPAPDVPRVTSILSQSQSIEFLQSQLPAKTFGNPDFAISATSNRGLLVSFMTSDPMVATVGASTLTGGVSTATVTITGAGPAVITAIQPGNADTASATPVPRDLTVAKANQTITFAALPDRTFNEPDFTVSATSTSLLAPTFSVVSGPATIAGNLVTLTGAGNVTIRAAQAGNTNYNAAPNVDRTFAVAKSAQTITFASIGSPRLINAGSFGLTASAAPSGLPVSFTSSNPSVASVSGSTVTVNTLGSTVITASQAGNADYDAAPNRTQTLVVNPVAPQIISLPALNQTAVKDSPFVFGPITLNPLSFSANRVFTMSTVPGLAVNPQTGIISGTPTTEGNYSVTLTVTNETGSDFRMIALEVKPPAPRITSPVAVSVVAGTPIVYTVTTNPATGPTLTATGLPGWLTFTAPSFSGTPTVPGTHTIQITATNATGSAVLDLVITVTPNPDAPVYSGTLTPSGTAGDPFTFATNFGSSATATTYSLVGTPPSGMVIGSATGIISWPLPVVGTHSVTVSALRGSLSTSATLSITINPAATAPVVTITGGNVRAATVGTLLTPIAMTATPAATSFSIGTLPAGLSVGGTPTAPTITGTPTTPGTSSVAISASNSAGVGPVATLVITVAPHANAPVITSSPVVPGRVLENLTYTLMATSGGSPVTPPVLTYGMTGSLPTGLNFDGAAGTVTGTPAAGTAGQYRVFFAGTIATGGVGTGLALEVTFNIAPPLTVPVVNSNGTASGQVGQAFRYEITATNSPTSFGASPLPAGLLFNPGTGIISGVPSAVTVAGTPASVTLTASNGDGTSNPKILSITISPAPATPMITSGTTANARVGQSFSYQITATDAPTSFVATGLPAGLILTPGPGVGAGLISGTPTMSGPISATIAAANAAGLGASSPLAFIIAPAASAPAINSDATAAGQVGAAFSYRITVVSGSVTSFALTGTLPVGLSLNTSTGFITGSPTSPGVSNVSLTATNDGGTSLPQPLSIQIAPAANVPVVTSAGGANGNVGAAFSYTIEATNTPTSRDAVNLPPGLAVNPYTGIISGTPTTVGRTVSSLVAANAAGTGPTRDLTINIDPALSAPVVTGANQVGARAGTAFTYQITATGAPTSYEVIGAPAWMTIDTSTGLVAGTPTEPDFLVVFLLASNSAGRSGPKLFFVNIAAAAGTPVITSSRTVSGTAGTAFAAGKYTVTATSATTPTFRAFGLPPGLVLDSATGAVTGTPTSSGSYTARISATNASGVGAAVNVVFQIAPSITFGL